MADKAISELVAAEQITPTDMFVLEQNGTAKKLTGQVLLNWLTEAADGHGGIQNISKIRSSGLIDTYRITLADTTTFDFVVTNGRGVTSVSKTGTSGLVDTYRISYNDGSYDTFTVTNGAKGDRGDNTYVWIKYASQEPTATSHSFGDIPDNWIGIYAGGSAVAPADWQQYDWFQIKGEKGDTGAPATLASSQITYQAGDSGTVIPSGAWSTTIPTVAQGKYLWTRQVLQFNTGSAITSYSVSRFGIDGTGAVSTVAGVSPDASGNVALTASDMDALSIHGGTMDGSINMNGQRLTGLNTPTASDEAATKDYVDNAKLNLNGYATENYADAAAAAVNYPFNYADNSDFTQFVAQAGVGGSHRTKAYAGDRWILDSGTVTGEANENGNGYSNIQLTGTIRQIIANPPAVGSVFVEMVSGTATAVYENGAVKITSNGGVIRNVLLCEGEYTEENKPKYQPKGYGAEFAECQRYYIHSVGRCVAGYGVNTRSKLQVYIPTPVTMRVKPTATLVFANDFVINTGNIIPVTGVSTNNVIDNGVLCTLDTSTLTAHVIGVTGADTKISLSADFKEDI